MPDSAFILRPFIARRAIGRSPTGTPVRHRASCGAAAVGLLAAAWLAGCSTTPPRNAALDAAHRAFQQASSNPDVVKNAQLELDRARQALARADRNWTEERDERETAHLSYLASQQTEVAVNTAMQRAADEMVTSAGAQRERIQAEARAQEAQAAQARAQNAQASAASANQRADQLEQELARLHARNTSRGLVVVLQDVLFDVGKAQLRSGALSRLQQLATVLKNNPQRHLKIEGFTDSTGSAESNQKLSERRAEAVRDALVNMGVDAQRLDVQGYGEERPVASNRTSAGRQQNRRVEVVFSDAQGQFANP